MKQVDPHWLTIPPHPFPNKNYTLRARRTQHPFLFLSIFNCVHKFHHIANYTCQDNKEVKINGTSSQQLKGPKILIQT